MAKDLLDRDRQLLQERLTNCQKESQLLQQQLTECLEQRQIFQQQLAKCHEENHQLLTAQQESVAFGIEPWRVSHDKVKLGHLIGGGGWGAVHEGNLKVAVKQLYPHILSERNLA